MTDQTATRAPPGSFKGLRPNMGEKSALGLDIVAPYNRSSRSSAISRQLYLPVPECLVCCNSPAAEFLAES
jgi:hypothetical protein